MRIAFVYDRVNKFGGAERVLLALHEIWPEAPLYSAIYSKDSTSWADVFQVIPSFLNKLPFSSTNHEIFPLLTPFAFESFDFAKFDVVLSITSSDAKGLITNPNTLHICYLLTPTRYLWNGYHDYLENPGFSIFNPIVRMLMKLFSPSLRIWDLVASTRPDIYITISKTVQKRVSTFYKRDAKLIYPPVDIDKFKPDYNNSSGTYFLIVARLVPYKKIDYVIDTFNECNLKLKIIGNGIDEERLKSRGSHNIEFIINGLTDEKLCWYYQNCKGLIFPGEEDFGISAVEAQACGKPVIGINKGGASEIIIPGITGEVYDSYSKEALLVAINKMMKKKYSVSDCRNNAAKFAKQNFQKAIKNTVESYWNMRRSKYSN